MPIPGAKDTPSGLSGQLSELTEHLSRWFHLEIELALIELKHGLKKLVAGALFLLGALVLGLFSVGFALAGAAAAIGGSGVWDGLLIIAGVLLVLAGGASAAGIAALKKARLAPTQALDEVARTKEALRDR